MACKVPKFGAWENEENISYTTSYAVRGRKPKPQGQHSEATETKAEYVPQENIENIGYTVNFDMARKRRKQKNKNNENQDTWQHDVSAAQTLLAQRTDKRATIPKWGDWDKSPETQKEKRCCCPWF